MPGEKPVLQYEANGRFVKKHDSQSAAAREFGLHPSTINIAVSGKVKIVGGCQWRRYTEGEPIVLKISAVPLHGSTAVLQYDGEGCFLARYGSAAEACRRVTSAHYSGISEVINGKRKTSGGYQWRRHLKGEPIPQTITPIE